jgi:AraC-like DNA-binding protein
VRPETLASRRRLYLLARVVVARHYRRELTLAGVAGALSSSPRALQRAYAQFGELSFSEDLTARRMAAAAELLLEQRSIPVASVARLVGYRQPSYFAAAFRRRFGVPPARFREAPANGDPSRYRGAGRSAALAPALSASGPTSPSSAISAASAPGRRSRISVPPPGGDSAAMVPPC